MAKPRIGITGRAKTGDQIVGTPETLLTVDGYWFYADYARAISEAGGIPLLLGLHADPDDYLSCIDGLLLSGGADISPDVYGAQSETDEFPPEPERDAFELALLKAASAAETPTLGICRGLQLVNVACGGTLHQHVPSHSAFDHPVHTLTHAVATEPGSTIAGLYGEQVKVNSLHHQTVDRVGASLAVTGRAEDGTVEALEHPSLPILAVQWHPEMLPTRPQDPIFSWLVGTARQ